MKYITVGLDDATNGVVAVGPFDSDERAAEYGMEHMWFFETIPIYKPALLRLECGHSAWPDDTHFERHFWCTQCDQRQEIIELGPPTGDIMKESRNG